MVADTKLTPQRYSEFLGRVIEEFNLNTGDPFTRLLAATFAFQDHRDYLQKTVEFLTEQNTTLLTERKAAFALLRVCQNSVHPDTRTVIRALIADEPQPS